MLKVGMSVFVGALMLGTLGCDDGAADKAENAGRCRIMCENVAECLDRDDDDDFLTECRGDCRDESEDEDYEADVKACQQCVDSDDKCVEKAIDCADECAGVITL